MLILTKLQEHVSQGNEQNGYHIFIIITFLEQKSFSTKDLVVYNSKWVTPILKIDP
jgi:hypothetical protein